MSAVIEKDLLAPAIADDALGQAKALLGMPIRVGYSSKCLKHPTAASSPISLPGQV